ncbi:hypothetical protein AB0C34_19765 [Nocardia sp. NPDC049220]|uniref:hypothetical protein n=1 Tax=Nocardia sp. NPDC049220 TaxID=3155273 RepID=UPI0033CD7436
MSFFRARRPTRTASTRTDMAYSVAGAEASIDPGLVGLVQTHGPGTPVGDPIEFRTLSHRPGSSRVLGDVGTGWTGNGRPWEIRQERATLARATQALNYDYTVSRCY